jgi:hypothetical protein
VHGTDDDSDNSGVYTYVQVNSLRRSNRVRLSVYFPPALSIYSTHTSTVTLSFLSQGCGGARKVCCRSCFAVLMNLVYRKILAGTVCSGW